MLQAACAAPDNASRPRMPLPKEAEIVWKENPRDYRYVRETTILSKSRTRDVGRTTIPDGLVVAYATLDSSTPPDANGCFRRRVFYVLRCDRIPGGCPSSEGIPVTSIRARR